MSAGILCPSREAKSDLIIRPLPVALAEPKTSMGNKTLTISHLEPGMPYQPCIFIELEEGCKAYGYRSHGGSSGGLHACPLCVLSTYLQHHSHDAVHGHAHPGWAECW